MILALFRAETLATAWSEMVEPTGGERTVNNVLPIIKRYPVTEVRGRRRSADQLVAPADEVGTNTAGSQEREVLEQ
jgi:hypothetical protein